MRERVHPMIHFLNGLQGQGWAGPEPEARRGSSRSPMWIQGLMWAILCCFPRGISRTCIGSGATTQPLPLWDAILKGTQGSHVTM